MAPEIILTCEEKDHLKLTQVKLVLDSIPGQFFKFIVKMGSKGSFLNIDPERELTSEQDFFDSMNGFRKWQDVGDGQYLVYFTSRAIPGGYFNGIEFERKNIFVDLENWDRQFLKGSPDRYPIAFHVLISLLINHYFPDKVTAQKALHWVDKGCILDFNGHKEKVDLKILTARICPDCLDILLGFNPDPNLLAYFRSGIERIRQDIVNGEYYEKIKPKPVKITLKSSYNKKLGYELEFQGIGSLELDAVHMAVYLNFLRRKEGLHLYQIWKDYYCFRCRY